jgi:hypothetical protein
MVPGTSLARQNELGMASPFAQSSSYLESSITVMGRIICRLAIKNDSVYRLFWSCKKSGRVRWISFFQQGSLLLRAIGSSANAAV